MAAKTPSDAPDPAELASQFLDLWQRQVSLLAGQGGLADMFAALAELMAGRHDREHAAGTNGAAAAAAASGDSGFDQRELARRLAACEARLARLEQELARTRARAGAKPRRRRS